MATSLESVSLNGPQGSFVDVKAGDKVAFINPEVIRDPRDKRIHTGTMQSTEKDIGEGPYEIIGINRYRSGNTLLTIRGPKGESEIHEEYFTAA